MEKKKELPLGMFSEAVLQRHSAKKSGIAALASRVFLLQIRLPSRIPAVQRTIPVWPNPPSNLSNGWDSVAQGPYAVDAIVLAFYFVKQEKRGIFAVQPTATLGTTYKTA